MMKKTIGIFGLMLASVSVVSVDAANHRKGSELDEVAVGQQRRGGSPVQNAPSPLSINGGGTAFRKELESHEAAIVRYSTSTVIEGGIFSHMVSKALKESDWKNLAQWMTVSQERTGDFGAFLGAINPDPEDENASSVEDILKGMVGFVETPLLEMLLPVLNDNDLDAAAVVREAIRARARK